MKEEEKIECHLLCGEGEEEASTSDLFYWKTLQQTGE